MLLKDWLSETGKTAAEAAGLFDCSEIQIRHMTRKQNRRAPGRKLAAEIVRVTLGAVGYDDLFDGAADRRKTDKTNESDALDATG